MSFCVYILENYSFYRMQLILENLRRDTCQTTLLLIVVVTIRKIIMSFIFVLQKNDLAEAEGSGNLLVLFFNFHS